MKVCPECNNKRHIFKPGVGWVRCKCVDQLRADRIMSDSGFPEALHTIKSESFIPGNDIERKQLASGISKIVKEYNKKPVFIYSKTPDKDRAAAIICRYLSILHSEIESIKFDNLDSLVKQQFGKEEDSTQTLFDADIAVISIGKEMTNKAHQNFLYSILYDRILAEKFTIITSFVPKNRILQVYHEGIDKLMEQNFEFYSC